MQDLVAIEPCDILSFVLYFPALLRIDLSRK